MADVLERRNAQFVVWRPAPVAPPPVLVIGQFQPGNPPSLINERRIALRPAAGFADLFVLDAAACGLTDGEVYHYWFEVSETAPWRPRGTRVLVSDPFGWAVDWRLRAPPLPPPYTADDRHPASVIQWRSGRLIACDPAGEVADFGADPCPVTLPANNRLVVYELPTA